MADLKLQGVFPPIPTPFVDGEVSYERLASNVEKWSKTGISGFVVLGSNGEYPYLSEEEKRNVVRTVIRASPEHLPVIVGSGCESTRETIRLTNDCAELGAHAALVVTPHYYGGKMDKASLVNHYTVIADQAAIPILLYNVTKFTHLNLTADVVSTLSGHPNIVGIKDSNGSVSQLGEYLEAVQKDFHVLVGTAGAFFGGLALGCEGGILALANVAPEACVKMYESVGAGQFRAARDLQLRMIPVNQAVTATYGIAGLKAAMDMLGYFGGDPRLPLLPSTEKENAEIRNVLIQAHLLT